MSFWYTTIGVVAFIGLFPFFRCFFKRLSCLIKIKRVCRKKKIRFYATHSLWFLGKKTSKNCDFYLETANEVFAIKFFGMPRRLSFLIFKENGEYFIRSYITFFSYGGGYSIPINSKPKTMPTYDFRYNYKDEWELKNPRNILLVNPVSLEFRRQPQHGSEMILGVGDVVNGMEIDSISHLLIDLERAIQ